MNLSIFKSVNQIFNQSNIRYMLGNETLVGAVENNVYAYIRNPVFYIFDYSVFKMAKLIFISLFNGIILKPKLRHNQIILKGRKKISLTWKNPQFFTLKFVKKTKLGFEIQIKNKKILFDMEDMNPKNLTTLTIEECTVSVPENPERFVEKYKKNLFLSHYSYTTKLQSNEVENLIVFLNDVCEILKRNNVNYWLEGGTLLGAIRNSKLIPWDHDLDIGLLFESEEKSKKIVKILKKRFKVKTLDFPDYDDIWQLGDIRLLKVYKNKFKKTKTDPCLDIFFYYKGELENVGPVYKYVVWNRNAYHPEKFLNKLKRTELEGFEFPVPGLYEEFLEAKYGLDWKTPKKEWNVGLDDGSVIQPR